MSLTRRLSLLGGLGGLAAGVAPAIVRAQRPPLRVQCMGGAVEKIIREDILPGFEKQHGMEVQLIVEDDVTILPKLQVSRGRAPYDVCLMDNDKAILGAEAGLWAPDVSGRLSNIGAILPSCKPPATAHYANIVFEYALVARTDNGKPPVAAWADLWTPGLTVAVPHVTQGYGLVFLYIAAMLNGGSARNLDPGFAAIKRLGSYKVYRSVSQGLSLFQQKEVDAGLFYVHRAQQMINAGLPVAKIAAREGVWGMRTGLQIPKNTGAMDGAVAWVDTMLSAPAQTAMAKGLYGPTNRNVVYTPEMTRDLIPLSHVDEIREAPWSEILPQRDAILDKWTRELGA